MFCCKEDNRRRSELCQDYLMPQMDIDTSQMDVLSIDSSLDIVLFISVIVHIFIDCKAELEELFFWYFRFNFLDRVF